MADISNCGLYVIIKNVEQLKKTFSIIKELNKKEISMHFETINENGEKKNYLKISELGFDDKVGFTVKHEMYNDDDKFKCLTGQNAYNTNFANVCVQLEYLDEIFKKLTNNNTVIFYTYLKDEDLNISITSESATDDISIPTLYNENEYDELPTDKFIPVCQVLIRTQLLNDKLKSFNKFCEDITFICTSETFILQTPQTINAKLTIKKSIKNDKTPTGVAIKMFDDNNMIIQSTYVMKFLKIISKIDDKFCESVNLYFIKTASKDNYLLLLSYSYNNNENMKIMFLPKDIEIVREENSEQINY